MKLGLFMMPLHPPQRPLTETLQEDAEKTLLADQIGFDEVWVGEHFACVSETIPSPMMFMASLVRQTQRVKFGTGVISMPAHHPALLACEIALFDHIADSRFILGIGPGGLASDMELFGNLDGAVRNDKMVELIDTILKIWGQDPPYDIPGKYWNVSLKEMIIPELGVGWLPKPKQRPHPEIAQSAMSSFSSSMLMAGERGWSPLSANFTPTYSVASHWQKFKEGCAKVDRTPNGADWRVARNIVVAPTDAEAQERARDPAGSNHFYFNYLWKALKAANYTIVIKPDPKMADEELSVEKIIDDLVIYGSPKTVVEKLIAFRETVGPFGTLLMAGMDWMGVNRAREQESMNLLADEVAPALRRALGMPLAVAAQ